MKEENFKFDASFCLRVPEACAYGDEHAQYDTDGTITNVSQLASKIEDKWADAIRDEFGAIEMSRKLPNISVEVTECKDADADLGEFNVSLVAETNCPVMTDEPEEVEGDLRYAIMSGIERIAKSKGWKVSLLDVA